jgi:hypothetical protein
VAAYVIRSAMKNIASSTAVFDAMFFIADLIMYAVTPPD